MPTEPARAEGVVSDRARDALYRRLDEAVERYEVALRHAERARKQRNILAAKLVTAGEPTRKVGAVAKVSSSGISQMIRRRDWDE